jgi:hypothetical protein
MVESQPSVLARVAITLGAIWRVLVNPRFATAVAALHKAQTDSNRLESAEPNAALQLLALLQQDGRFIDFLREDVTAYSDAEIGAAARVVHTGCRQALDRHFTMAPVRPESEGARITLQSGFDPAAVRLTGRVLGEPPFTGRLAHRGWRVTETRLPQVASGHDLSILAPAEVEL